MGETLQIGCGLDEALISERRAILLDGQLRLVRKEHPNSVRKIDTVVGDALALEARADALAAGWSAKPPPTFIRLPR